MGGLVAGGAYAGFVWWYYYKGEGYETAYQTDEYKDNLTFTVTPIRDSFYMLHGDGGNITVLKGDDGVLMVDTDENWAAPALIRTLKERELWPVRYVINTHSHGDHRGGNGVFHDLGAEIIAHPEAAVRIGNDDSPWVTQSDCPTILADDGMSFNFAGQRVEFYHPDDAHTDNDLVVRFLPANILSTGDVYVQNGVPFLDRRGGASLAGHLAAQAELMSLSDDDTVIVPGHGSLSDRKELKALDEELSEIYARVVWMKAHHVPRKLVPLFHPMFDWPMDKYTGYGWEKFWLNIVYDAAPPERPIPQPDSNEARLWRNLCGPRLQADLQALPGGQ